MFLMEPFSLVADLPRHPRQPYERPPRGRHSIVFELALSPRIEPLGSSGGCFRWTCAAWVSATMSAGGRLAYPTKREFKLRHLFKPSLSEPVGSAIWCSWRKRSTRWMA